MTEIEATNSYPVSPRNRVKRLHERGRYDHATVHGLLDASMLCHVSYAIDGQPYCTPTFFWREGSRLYWHGSSASRMLENQSDGQKVCLTVAHLDSLVLARCGFNHSADYRAVMAFGTAYIVTDPDEKARALVAMVDRFFPDRTASLRQSTKQEIKASAVIAMEIEEASAKVRTKGVADDDEDYALPIYAERIPVRTVIGAPEPCPRLLDGVKRPQSLRVYSEGRLLDDALREAHLLHYPDG
ncbi:pyridoxamine 5'-phosphate oxidase family protein [Bradyrhizobium sp. AUGA SZCCT0240]|uniref:pyridoxamine 5'-phosphate oxidase family protein n=1 Tax=unclassified Bradyrhizobium TaxID=2631580 RepID=UPI001BA8EB6C|nr:MULTISPECIES: pyridoxamine 5'-phosphate oxidase family protein [unclassified Bradyrhizobium]MBR1198908.1 pyridoxamine 5'-phosphate oxidase family protein [Bradyrhizobium sp. AUGA SZCCT0158]MBR1244392.1 pyridoxamine 5'-phosphate oxidase family protein [Bradyrhizobium sp. AUGA SZCCT0274]MBR1253312.1 pyridoxamine 5'-phosphate oxidase family protein [Bradyrhizobium sp. AUGA SZCCT0240]